MSQTSGFFALRRCGLYLSFNLGFLLGIALPAHAGSISPGIETAAVLAAPADFRFASIDRALDQPIQDGLDFDFLMETEAEIAADGLLEAHWYNHFGHAEVDELALASRGQRFDAAAAKADLSPARLASLFNTARASEPAAAARGRATFAVANGAPVRVASFAAPVDVDARLALAYADPSPAPSTGALGAIARMAPADGEGLGSAGAEGSLPLADQNDLSDEHILPSAAPLPGMRPLGSRHMRETPAEALKPGDDRRGIEPNLRRDMPKREQLAYARPENPNDDRASDRPGWGLKNLFGRPRAGRGVAVYDISAAKVYMPDGSVLEAHSGIGKMADNPKYVHVKMNGPTPPSTYNLRMRESRFHGVEAIRMLPVDGKNPHGRTGLLTHSYLLRGGRAESHGCVAFKDYNRFLTAFKKGKVKQLVVVPGGGRTTLLARNG